jgi:hypothetical protein
MCFFVENRNTFLLGVKEVEKGWEVKGVWG